ncbi:MAG: hypothetical protein GOVbin568_28 [Prokaryotic dsDNA virus sp.]|nr:MAG: hypothetical protein GOVbin568_28 [Prokaryotic dsDNA virus sp.]|tara:strand:+ start:1169 stop:1390 length:222 start_codon:yes stop_codon:yes gene_type:complete
MIYDEFARLIGYDVPIIEIYNEQGQLEYVLDLDQVELEDVDIVQVRADKGKDTYYGVIKLYRHEQTKLNGTEL